MIDRTNPDSVTRYQYAWFFPFDNRELGSASHTQGEYTDLVTYAPDDPIDFVVERDTSSSLPARQITINDNTQNGDVCDVASDPPSSCSEEAWKLVDGATVSAAFLMPASGMSEDTLLVLSNGAATSGDGDADGTKPIPLTTTTFTGEDQNIADHFGDARVVGDTLYAGLMCDPDEQCDHSLVTLISAQTGAAPTLSFLEASSPLDATAYADVGGGSALDVITLQDGTVGVYLDVAFASNGTAVPTAAFGDRTALPGYDTLAVGNFFGDARLEIYAINSTNPAAELQCFHVGSDAMSFQPCEDD